MTNSCYDISYINEVDSKGFVQLGFRFFEGSYQDITIDGVTVNMFVREKVIEEGQIYFDFYKVPDNDFVTTLKTLLAEASKLPLILEQA